jgi:prophage DNA circulation protein
MGGYQQLALFDELLPASFRGVPFLVDSSTTGGGRKTSTNEYPNSDRRFVEDLGLLNKTFSIRATLTGPNYSQKRDALIRALETSGPGLLIHPFFGIQNVVAKPYTLEERMTSLGEARFNLVFENAQEAILPQPVTGTMNSVFTAINEAILLIQVLIIQGLLITNSDNFLDALSKVNNFIGTVGFLTNEFVSESEAFDTFSKTLTNFADNSSAILADTTVLSENITNTFTTLDDAISTPQDSKNLFQELFNFGDDDITLELNTSKNIEREKNRSVLNGSIQAMALLMNYRNVVQVTFTTVDEINEERLILDDQYEQVISNTAISRSDKTKLQNSRNLVRQFLDKEAIRAFKITDFNTKDTTINALAYRLYGSTDNVDALINLNNFRDLLHIEGDIKILTR